MVIFVVESMTQIWSAIRLKFSTYWYVVYCDRWI